MGTKQRDLPTTWQELAEGETLEYWVLKRCLHGSRPLKAQRTVQKGRQRDWKSQRGGAWLTSRKHFQIPGDWLTSELPETVAACTGLAWVLVRWVLALRKRIFFKNRFSPVEPHYVYKPHFRVGFMLSSRSTQTILSWIFVHFCVSYCFVWATVYHLVFCWYIMVSDCVFMVCVFLVLFCFILILVCLFCKEKEDIELGGWGSREDLGATWDWKRLWSEYIRWKNIFN